MKIKNKKLHLLILISFILLSCFACSMFKKDEQLKNYSWTIKNGDSDIGILSFTKDENDNKLRSIFLHVNYANLEKDLITQEKMIERLELAKGIPSSDKYKYEYKIMSIPYAKVLEYETFSINLKDIKNTSEVKDVLEYIGIYKYSNQNSIILDIDSLNEDFPYYFIMQNGVFESHFVNN